MRDSNPQHVLGVQVFRTSCLIPLADLPWCFAPNGPLNNGNLFSASDDDIVAGFEEAERRGKTLGLNKNGMLLQQQTYAQTLDVLLKGLE